MNAANSPPPLGPAARLAALALMVGAALTHCSSPASTVTNPPAQGTHGSASSSGGTNQPDSSMVMSGDDDSLPPGEGGPGGGDAGQPGSDDASASDDAASGDDGSCPADDLYPQTRFVDMAVPLGEPLTPGQSDTIPGDAGVTTPPGWDFHQGGTCRDGSPAGFYVHYSTAASSKLFIYLEGGGACDSSTFCSHNPPNIQTVFSGGPQSQGQTILGSLSFATTGQVPYTAIPASGLTPAYSPGIFDFTNAANPFKDWNAVYVPYCTGDVHFGTLDDVDVPSDGVLPDLPNQHFVGNLNLKSYIARIVPTFPNLTQVLLTGASAGAFGAGLNYPMVKDTFGSVPVAVIMDSGLPFRDMYLPPCIQEQWRNLWGFNDALPPDCTECFADGGVVNIVYYLLHKYKQATIGAISTMQDEVIRLFFSQGDNMCQNDNATWLTLTNGLDNGYPGSEYTAGIQDLLQTFQCTNRIAAYQIGGASPSYPNPTYHQHIFRDEFYQAITNDGGVVMADWANDFVNGNLQIVGP